MGADAAAASTGIAGARVAFALGYDTAERLVSPRYYGGDESAMLAALAGICSRGVRFVVGGRLSASGAGADAGRFLTFDADLRARVPPALRGAFVGLAEADFREDVSSTELRARAAAAAAAAAAAGDDTSAGAGAMP